MGGTEEIESMKEEMALLQRKVDYLNLRLGDHARDISHLIERDRKKENAAIEVGQWGKFSDYGEGQGVYGKLTKIDWEEDCSYLCGGNTWFEYFTPIPGLKEAIQDKEF